MMHSIELLKERFKYPLPGEEAHKLYAPTDRPLSSFALKNSSHIRESAVSILLFEQQKDFYFVLIERPTYDGVHSGQMAFPGGKKEQTDKDLIETAIRETQEEIGVVLENSFVIGQMTPVFIPVSQFYVEPIVFHVPFEPEFLRDEREVSAIYSVPVKELLTDTVVKRKNIPIGNNGFLKEVPYFDLAGKVVWGATALMLGEFKKLLHEL